MNETGYGKGEFLDAADIPELIREAYEAQEFCSRAFQIVLAKSPEDYRVYCLEELLPAAFGASAVP